METVIFLILIGVVAILADRFGDDRRPVHHSPAYRQALTGMIREPWGHTHLVAPPLRGSARTMEAAECELEPTPPDLVVQPT